MTRSELPSENKPHEHERRKPALKWARYGAFGFGGTVLAVAAVVGIAGTGPVLRALTPMINETVSAATDSSFELGRIEGSLWTGLTLDGLRMERAADGFHLDLDQVDFDWSPLALLGGKLQINHVGLQTASIVLPDGSLPDTPDDETPDESGGFSLPLAVSVDAIDLREIALVDPVSGKGFLYSLKANGAIGTNLSATAALNLQPLDGGSDQLDVDLDFDGPKQRLSASIDGELGREGVVMTLAGVTPDIAPDVRIKLAGDGPADDWNGKLELTAGGYAALTSDVGVQLSSDVLAFSLDGGGQTFDRISGDLPEPLRGDIALGIGGAFNADDQKLALDRITVAMADVLDLSASAHLDLAENLIAARLDGDIDPALSGLLDDAVRWGQVALSVEANGDLAMPGLVVAIDGQDVATPVSTIARMQVRANMPASDGDGPVVASLDASTSGTVWQDSDLGAFLGADQELSLNALVNPDFSRISVGKLVLTAPQMAVNGSAEIDDTFSLNGAKLVGDVADLSIFAPISGLDLGGQGKVTLDNLSWSEQDGLKSDVTVSGTQTVFGISDLDRIVGPSPTISGKVALLPNLDLMVDLDAVNAATLKGPVKVDITNEFERLAVTADLDVAPGTVPPDIGVAIAPAKLSVRLDGDIAAPPGQIDLRVPSVKAGGQRIDNVVLSSRMSWSDQAVLALRNSGSFNLGKHAYDIAANLRLPENDLLISDILLRGEFLDLGGELVLPGYAVPMRGSLELTKLDAEMLGDFGVPFANGTISGDIGFVPEDGRQTVTLSALAKGLRIDQQPDGNPAMIENVNIAATIRDAFAQPDIKADIEGKDIVFSPIAIDDVTVGIMGGLDAFDVTMNTTGFYQGNVPMSADLAANIGLGYDIRVVADKFDFALSDQTIKLRRPLQFVMAANGQQNLDADVTVGSGRLVATVAQEAGQKSIAGDLSLDDVDLGPWGRIAGYDGLSGVANLSANLRETKGALPVAAVKGRISGITANTVKDMEPFEMVLNLDLAKGILNGTANLGNRDVKILSAQGTVPLAVSVLAQNFSPDLAAPVSASVRMNGEIAEFWPYVPAPDHQVSGTINLELDVAGTLDDIGWKGNLGLSDGHYENLVYGTILEQVTLAGEFDQNGLSIPSITATDGGNGKLDASVDLTMKDGGEAAYDVTATLRNFALSRVDELQFWADVDTKVTGNQESADIESTVTVQRGEVDLSLALPESVPTIEVANLPDEEEKEEARKAAEKDNGFSGNLDVTVDIPGRLFVRGKGLDSEWGGRLEISGTADDPSIVGQLSALRGQLDIIGKTFVIKDSKITFAGGSPPDPMLDIKGVYTTADLEVTAGFQGPSSDPELVLTSVPSLPEDEILSQVLFGKSQGSLSAVEAVQLASAVNELSGGGSGLDVVGSVRRFIGADVLQVGGGENGPEVKVGKYLTEGVYVGTKAGSTPGSSGVEVEIEVTPNISVTSETTEIDSKAGVQYRLDY